MLFYPNVAWLSLKQRQKKLTTTICMSFFNSCLQSTECFKDTSYTYVWSCSGYKQSRRGVTMSAKVFTVSFIKETSPSSFKINSTRLASSSLAKCFIFTLTEVCPSIVQRVCISILQPKLSSAYLLIQGRVCSKVTSMRKGCSHTKAKSSSAVGGISVSNRMSSFRSTTIIEFIS